MAPDYKESGMRRVRRDGRYGFGERVTIPVVLLALAASPPVAPPARALSGRTYVTVSGEGTNSGFVAGSRGTLVIDAPALDSAARDLASRIRAAGGARPWFLARTRPAPPSPGDDVLRRAGASPASAGPLDLGGSTVSFEVARVHPGGDTITFVAPDDVVFAGELVEKNAVPDLSGSDTRGWARLLDGFLERHPAAHFVGARGEPLRALDVRYLRDYVAGLRLAVEQARGKGESLEALAERLLPLQRARVGHWTGFDARARRNIEAVEREISGPASPPRP
jgi:hypothetical protein